MVKKDTWVLVNKNLLRRVRGKLTELYRKLRASYKAPPEKAVRIMRKFRETHPMDGGVSRFFQEYYRTNLIARRENDDDNVMMFGFLRTLFVAILREAPRINVFSKRVKDYRETYSVADALEKFLTLYRKRVGFTKTPEHEVSRNVLREAGLISECTGLPESRCQPPLCRYVRTVQKGKLVEYCTRHEKRRRYTAKKSTPRGKNTRRRSRAGE